MAVHSHCTLVSSATVITIALLLSGVNTEAQPQRLQGQYPSKKEQEILTRFLLSRLLGKDVSIQDKNAGVQRRGEDQQSAGSYIHSQISQQEVSQPLQALLDQAKANIDVIDFRNPQENKPFQEERDRFPREPTDFLYQDSKSQAKSSPSDTVPVFLPFPGTENSATKKSDKSGGSGGHLRFSVPATQLGDKQYYMGIFFKANWYKAQQYCRFHNMELASISSEGEQKKLEDHITDIGMGHEHFWTSGTDQAEEGKFFWMANGRPLTYENWNAGEPNNFQYDNGEEEHCLELWNRDGKGLRWNDTPCSFETFFICQL